MPSPVPGSSPQCADEGQRLPSVPARRPQATGPERRRRGLPIAETSAGMRVYRVRVHPPDVVYLKSILEASEGLGAIFAERGGDLIVAAPHERAKDLAEMLADVALEIEAAIDLGPSDVEGDEGDTEATPSGSTR
jgi:hypothetical protein